MGLELLDGCSSFQEERPLSLQVFQGEVRKSADGKMYTVYLCNKSLVWYSRLDSTGNSVIGVMPVKKFMQMDVIVAPGDKKAFELIRNQQVNFVRFFSGLSGVLDDK